MPCLYYSSCTLFQAILVQKTILLIVPPRIVPYYAAMKPSVRLSLDRQRLKVLESMNSARERTDMIWYVDTTAAFDSISKALCWQCK